MKLIVILICLGLERYWQVGTKLRQWHGFEIYFSWLQSKLSKTGVLKGWLGVALVILPVLIIIGLICSLFGAWLFGLIGLALSTVILLYCIGKPSADTEVKGYIQEEESEAETGTKATSSAVSIPSILWESGEQFFAVLFWYAFLGPLGAILYRMAQWLRQKAQTDSTAHALLKSALLLHEILGWLPARLVAFGYALMGNFGKTIGYWLDQVISGLKCNRKILSQCGALALGAEQQESESQLEQDAKTLIDRTLGLFIVVVAVFTLASWL